MELFQPKVMQYVKESDSATVRKGTVLDYVTTVLNGSESLVGMGALVQRVALVAAGASLHSKWTSGSFKFYQK